MIFEVYRTKSNNSKLLEKIQTNKHAEHKPVKSRNTHTQKQRESHLETSIASIDLFKKVDVDIAYIL